MMEKLTIVQILGSAKLGGAELFFHRLNAGLEKLPLINLSTITKKNNSLRSSLIDKNIKNIEAKFGGLLDFTTKSHIKHALNQINPKIVISWMNRATKHTPQGPWILVGRLGGYYNLKYYKHCDHLIANTRSITAWIKKQGWPENRVHYIPNFTADLSFPEKKISSAITRILSIGRLHPNKGFDTLINAMKFVPKNIQLTIAGSGPEKLALEKLIFSQNLDHQITLIEWQDDIKKLFFEHDIFVCPSKHEPLGNVIIEAFSAELPVIATQTDGAYSLITPEKNGLLCPINNPEALSKQIIRLAQNIPLQKQLAAHARNDFEINFSEHVVLKKWLAFFNKLEK